MQEPINACVDIDLHFFQFLQLLGREHGADLVGDVGALDGQIGFEGSHLGRLGANRRLVDGA